MCEQRHAGSNRLAVAGVEHRSIHPRRREARSDRVATRIQAVSGKTSSLENSCVRIEHVAECAARYHGFFHRLQRGKGGIVKLLMPSRYLSGQHRAHHGGVIMVEYAGPFQRQLVVLVELSTARLVAAEEGVRP